MYGGCKSCRVGLMPIHSNRQDRLQARLIKFGVSVCKFLMPAPRDPITAHFTMQLVRAATAPSAHYAEARDAESRRDFVHKMKVGLQDLRESLVWLDYQSELRPEPEVIAAMRKERDELVSIFVASIKTARD